MSEKTIYCDQCKFLEEREYYISKGRSDFDDLTEEKRYHCRKKNKDFDCEVNERTIGLCSCPDGEKIKSDKTNES